MDFLNIKTGEIYDCDLHNSGEGVFVNYFDGPQSINGIYTKRFVIFSPSIEQYTISIADDIFFLIKLPTPSQSNTEKIDNRDFYKLENIKVPSITINNTSDWITLASNQYITTFWVGCTSKSSGEFQTEIEIKDANNKKGYITVGADFYDEEEPLQKNLENFGVEIPSIFQKALFPVNLREDLNENIYLNQKRRELLTEYWNLIANKGSYDSLINSLKFFGYGDLVRIEEYWKRIEAGKDIYLGDDLEDILDDEIISKISKLKRTTYCGIYLLLNKYIKGVLDSETNPLTAQIESHIMRWVEEDLALKMTLLGNFFSTYFMPIHLDLLHSSIERRVFTLAHNIATGSNMSRRDYYNCNMPLNLTALENNTPINYFYLEDTQAFVYPDTIFANIELSQHLTNINTNFYGVEPLRPTSNDTVNVINAAISAAHTFNGIGKVVKFHVNIPSNFVDPDDFIWKQSITWSGLKYDGENYKHTSYVTILPELDDPEESTGPKHYSFDFYVLFTEVKEYDIYVEFETLNRRIYSNNIKIEIKDGGGNYLTPYLVERVPNDILYNFIDENNNTLYNQINCNDFSFINKNNQLPVPPPQNYSFFTQLLNCTNENVSNRLGVNSILMVSLKDEAIIVGNGISTNTVTVPQETSTIDYEQTLSLLKTTFPYYEWSITQRYLIESQIYDPDTQTTNLHYVLLGVRKVFTCLSENTLQTPDIYGTDDYKVVIKNTTLTTDRVLDEDRFFPMFHKITKLEEPNEISKDQNIAIIPSFKKSFELNANNYTFNWRFTNVSTGKVTSKFILNNSPREPFVDMLNENNEVESGYYKIELNILQDENVIDTINSCAFKVLKENN